MMIFRYFLCAVSSFFFTISQASAKNDWKMSNQLVFTGENVYELNVALPYEHYELESGLRLSLISDGSVDFKLGGNRLFNITENGSILFGVGYGSDSPYVKYGYRHSLFDKFTVDVGYSYFFGEEDSQREQVYAGLIYSFGETGEEDTPEVDVVIERESTEINDGYNKEVKLNELKSILKKQNSIVLHFSFDKTSVNNFAILKEKISTIIADDVDVKVVGHTDSTGNADINARVSYRRAKYVADWLVDNGLKRSKVTILGAGESDPIASNETEYGRAQNRRVEVAYNGKE